MARIPWNKGLTKETDFRIKGTPLSVRFWSKVEKTAGCWLWTGCKTGAGYGQIRVGSGKGKAIYAHRVSWEFANGPLPDDIDVLHSCDNPPCVRPDHLFKGTQTDNTNDCVKKGRFNRPWGENAPKAKLTNTQVLEIREALKDKYYGYIKDLMTKYGVSRGAIDAIHYKRNWRKL